MGTGRLLWTIRRPFFYGVIVLLICLLYFKINISDIWNGAFAGSMFNLFYAYILWSIPGLIIMLIISIIVLKLFFKPDSVIVAFLKFTFEDLISPVYNIIQLIIGFIVNKRGGDVDWPGCIWDVVWTLVCGGFIFWGIATQI